MSSSLPPPGTDAPPLVASRRAALTGLAALLGGGFACRSAVMAQTTSAQTAPAAPLRRLRLRAMPVETRLSGPDSEPSTLLRLAPVDQSGTAITDGGFPVLRARLGEEVALAIENGLLQPTAFHIRGLRGPNAADPLPGLAGTPLAPGAVAEIAFRARQSGTFLIQPVLPAHVAEQNARGLGAALIVEEDPAPAFDHDLVLAVSDWRLDEKGRLAGDFLDRRDTARVGRLGNRLVANGAPAPATLAVRPGARLRVRMVNAANARVIPLRVSGFPALVYAIDSTPCQPFDPLKRTVTLSPGTRIELVIEAPRAAGQAGAIEARLGEGLPILRLTTDGDPLPAGQRLAPLPDPGLPPAIRLQDASRAELVIAGGAPREPAEAEPAALAARFPDPARIFTLNDQPGGFSGRPLVRVRRGAVVVLALVNRTSWPQVIAVHGHAFRLLHPFDDGWEPYFLDTLYLAPGTTSRIAFIADNPGRWAIRSTIAEHFAAGVAGWFEVN